MPRVTPRKAPSSVERVEVEIVKMVPGGLGLAKVASRAYLVPHVCPGETVAIDVSSSPVRVLEVLRASPDRVEPACPVAARCGGCDFMHVRIERQAALHAEVVRELLAHASESEVPEVRVTRLSQHLGYRTRARLAFRSNGRGIALGFRVGRSHDIVEFDRCIVLDARLNPALAFARTLLAASTSEGEIALALGANGAPVLDIHADRDLAPVTFSELHRATEVGTIAGARVVLRDASKPLTFGDPRAVQLGADGLPLVVGAGGFAQASESGAIELARRVAALAEPAGKSVVELFAGSGTLSVLLAREARSFTGVELDGDACASLRKNLDARGIKAKLVSGDADGFAVPPCDVVVLDPPRAGAKRAIPQLVAVRPKRIVYVACDPATLARDVATLCKGGYGLVAVETVELFPQTSHVETVAVLDLRKAGKKSGGTA